MSLKNFGSYGDLETILTDFASAIKARLKNANVTTVQTTLTADKAYAVNDPFIYDGQLYKATSAITSGGTIVLSGAGQNASETTVEELISLSSSGAVPASNIKSTYQSSPTAGAEIYDASYINGLAGAEPFLVKTTNSSTAGEVQTAWCSDGSRVTMANGDLCYTKTLTLTNPIYGIAEVKPKATGTALGMTATEEANYNCLDYYSTNDSNRNQLKLYAKTKPTGNFYIWICRDGGRV